MVIMTGTRFNPCGNYSDTSNLRFLMIKGSLGQSFKFFINTVNLKIKKAFTLMFYMRFLFSLSFP